MKLLFETLTDTFELKEEVSDSGKKHYYLEGVFMQANIKNRNGRIYPMEVMEKEVNRYIKESVELHTAYGELGHPTGEGATSICFDNVSHIIEKIWRDGDYFKAKALILDTPKGKIVQELLKGGGRLGVSSRALGSVTRKEGTDYVGEDFHLITAGDIVQCPSAQAAYPNAIYESTDEYIFDEKKGEYRLMTENEKSKVAEDAEDAKEVEKNEEEEDSKVEESVERTELRTLVQSESFSELLKSLKSKYVKIS